VMSIEEITVSEGYRRVPERSSQHREALGVLGGSCAESMLIGCSVYSGEGRNSRLSLCTIS
jgi:hypothetical protein